MVPESDQQLILESAKFIVVDHSLEPSVSGTIDFYMNCQFEFTPHGIERESHGAGCRHYNAGGRREEGGGRRESRGAGCRQYSRLQ